MKKGPILDKTKKTRKHHAWCSRNRQICRVTLKSISESLEPSKFVKTAAFNWFICSFFFCLLSKKKKRIVRWKQWSSTASTSNDLRPLYTLSDVKRISSLSDKRTLYYSVLIWEGAGWHGFHSSYSSLTIDLGNLLTGGVQQAYPVTTRNIFNYWVLKSGQKILKSMANLLNIINTN